MQLSLPILIILILLCLSLSISGLVIATQSKTLATNSANRLDSFTVAEGSSTKLKNISSLNFDKGGMGITTWGSNTGDKINLMQFFVTSPIDGKPTVTNIIKNDKFKLGNLFSMGSYAANDTTVYKWSTAPCTPGTVC